MLALIPEEFLSPSYEETATPAAVEGKI